MAKYNDIDNSKWREYEDINTDSLWIIDKRDNSGIHSGHYHGNFIPQIPNQLFKRYTKKGDWILDPFMGSGTSIIEAKILNRNAIGIELQKDVAIDVLTRIKTEKKSTSQGKICIGDSKNIDISKILKKLKINKVHFVIMHPPYWNIIKFSENNNDLSNTETLENFLESLGKVIDNTTKYLERNRYCAIVIGDKYENGQVVPLGFYCMNLFLQRNFLLKAILVKNFENTKGKANQQALWRYRAITNDFYLFKHEYIFVFKKVK